MANQDSNSSSPDLKRSQIVVAAQQCFSTAGVANTSIEDIAQRSAISRRTIYRYFGNKTAIIQAVIDEQAAAFLQQMAVDLAAYQGDFFAFLEQVMLYLIVRGPTAPGHQLILADDDAAVSGKYYFSSHVLYHSLIELLSEPYAKAVAQDIVQRKDLSVEDLMQWVGRFVFSYIFYPVPESVLVKQVRQFVITPLQSPALM